MTDAEQLLWNSLRGKQLDGFRFRKQHPLGCYILDFYCPAVKLAIELDGGQHNSPEGQRRDLDRTEYLQTEGIRVLRFWNNEVQNNLDGTLQQVKKALHEYSPPDDTLYSGRTLP
jgi:very-short-patch-repair endonuclease